MAGCAVVAFVPHSELALVVAGVYLIPTVVAFARGVPSPWSVAVINVLLGWTLIGWAVALALAVRDPRPKPNYR